MKFSKFFKTKWRVVTDEWCGFAIQKKFWWFPVWFYQTRDGSYGPGTWSSAEIAMRVIEELSKPKFKPKVVATYEP